MNLLIVGRDRTDTILEHLPGSFLLIDDGPIIDSLQFHRRKVTIFDYTKHSFNPLKDMDYRRAREFINVLDAVFPEGENTLTKKTSNFLLLNALLSKPKSLDKLIQPKRNDSAQTDAYQKIQTLLLSPVLKNVLCKPTNFSFDGIILARLNRAELGDFDCFVLANLLISNYKGQVVVPDFGFYACPFHISLIRQERLITGLNFLDEVPKLRNHLLLIDKKIGHHCTAEDAETLFNYTGKNPDSVDHRDFITDCMK